MQHIKHIIQQICDHSQQAGTASPQEPHPNFWMY